MQLKYENSFSGRLFLGTRSNEIRMLSIQKYELDG
ncbi:MAG: hypothetical protein ACJA13_001063 [Paraglaciecola sp.]|jgi:hypothetical protein